MINRVEYITLLYFASQFGRYMSKFSLFELEYLLAKKVKGQVHFRKINNRHSKIIIPIPIQ